MNKACRIVSKKKKANNDTQPAGKAGEFFFSG